MGFASYAEIQWKREKILRLIMIITYFYLFVVPGVKMFQVAFSVESSYQFNNLLNLSYSGNIYGFYLVIGFCVARYRDKIVSIFAKNKFKLFIISGGVVSQIFFYRRGIVYNVWYDFFLVPICASSIFLLLIRFKWTIVSAKLLRELSSCAFGVYLVHEIILIVINKNIKY